MGSIDDVLFRQVLGRYPTGVAVVTSIDGDRPLGMIVGSFTSVSLDPPLVAYFASRSSQSYQRLQGIDRFCVNVVSVDQESLCRRFAARGVDKYAGVEWAAAPSGSPVIEGCIAWVDCEVESVTAVGDHDIVIGRVRALGHGTGATPMLFFRGGYGGFNARSLVSGFGTGLHRPLRIGQLAREPLELLADETGINCYAQVVVDGDLLIVAAAGPRGRTLDTHIGSRLPLQPPYGALFCVDDDDAAVGVQRWTATTKRVSDEERATLRATLDTVRDRGWSVGLTAPDHERTWQQVRRLADTSPTPETDAAISELLEPLRPYYDPISLPSEPLDVRILTAPVVVDGETVMVVALHGFTAPVSSDELQRYVDGLKRTAATIADSISAPESSG